MDHAAARLSSAFSGQAGANDGLRTLRSPAKTRGMTRSDIERLLVTTLTRVNGGSQQKWRRAAGTVQVYAQATHPHCNWDVRASGTIGEIAAVEKAVDDLRARHPIIGDEPTHRPKAR
jgi:hypothetical protein